MAPIHPTARLPRWLDAWAQVLARRPGFVLGAWGLLLAAAVGLAWGHPEGPAQADSTGASGTEAHELLLSLRRDFQVEPGNVLAVVVEGPASGGSEAGAASLEDLQDHLATAFPSITHQQLISGQRDPHLRVLALTLSPQVRFQEGQGLVEALRSHLQAWAKGDGRTARLTGHLAFFSDIAKESAAFVSASELVALVLALVILWLSFGGLLAAALPLLMGLASSLLLQGTLLALGLATTPMAGVMASLLGMALAIDYALFVVGRFREEQARGEAWEAALRTALAQSGTTIVVSALIVAASIAVLAIPEVSSTRLLARNLIMVVGWSTLNALVLLPACLALVHPWLTWLPSPWAQGQDRTRPWRRWARHVVGRAPWYLGASLLVLAALAWPASQLKLWDPVQSLASTRSESRQAQARLQAEGWGGAMAPVELMVVAPAGQRVDEGEGLRLAIAWSEALARHPDVAGVQGLPGWKPGMTLPTYRRWQATLRWLGHSQPGAWRPIQAPSGQRLRLLAFPRDAMDLAQSQRILAFARTLGPRPPGWRLLTGGVLARAEDFTHELYRRAPLMLGLVVLACTSILWWSTRAWILPWKAALMNLVPLVGALGILTCTHQWGWGQGWTGWPHQEGITSAIPLTLFCLMFGLSMDYEVLILSRITEAYEALGDPSEAIVQGMAQSGPLITGATLILLAVFLPSLAAPSPPLRELGLGMAAALLLDATLVRLWLVPSFMAVMGAWNWWSPSSPPR